MIKCGLGPMLLDLMKRGIVTAPALNGSRCVHDLEISLFGGRAENDIAAAGETVTAAIAMALAGVSSWKRPHVWPTLPRLSRLEQSAQPQ